MRRGIPRRKEKAVKKALGRLLLALLFLAGLALLLYPLISDLWNQRRSEALIRNYTQQFTQGPQRDYSEWFQRADAYNAALAGKGVPDAFALISPDEDADYLSQLSLSGDGVMAYIRIPRISVDSAHFPRHLRPGAGAGGGPPSGLRPARGRGRHPLCPVRPPGAALGGPVYRSGYAAAGGPFLHLRAGPGAGL